MKKLRPYQIEMKDKIYSAWSDHTNVLLVLPTGMGKTVTFCSIAIDYAINRRDKFPTAILVHRKELVQQISLTLAGEGVKHNIIAPRPVILQIIAAQRKVHRNQFYDYNAPITVVSVDTLNARSTRHEAWAKSIKLWITDEAAHLLKDNKWGKAVTLFTNAIGLGVTATPERLDKKGLGSHADGVFDTMVEGPDVSWGIEKGFLCKWKAVVPKSDYSKFLKDPSNRDFTAKEMEDAARESQIIGDVVDEYIKWALGKQSILFAPTISVGSDMERKFNERGIPAKLLTGDTPALERLQGLLDFQEKKLNVLLNVDLFDEGLDVPGIEVVQHARPTMSKGKYKQMNGRGLRPLKGKDYLLIIDHVGNIARHGTPEKKEKWTLDRIARRKKTTNLIRFCDNPMCCAPYDRELKECPFCGTPALKVSRPGAGERIPPEQVDGDLVLMDPETLKELEKATILETPEAIGNRVAMAAGTPAGIRAMKNQQIRIDTQKKLIDTIAHWAGEQTYKQLEDREIHKLFYLTFGKTIAESLGEPTKDMEGTIDAIRNG